MKNFGIAAALVAIASACGGGSAGNSAATKSFTYGSPTTASSTQSSAVDSSLSTASSQNTALSASEASSFGATSSVTSALLGSASLASRMELNGPIASTHIAEGRNALVAALTSASQTSKGFDDPSCAVVTATSVTMKNCVITTQDATGSIKVTASGNVTKTTSNSLNWDIKLGLTLNSTSAQGAGTLTETLHQGGTLAFTATTLKGSMLSELTAKVTTNGTSNSVGVDESVNVDVTFTQSPSSCVTGGTVEAKRVWTQRPNNVTSAQLPDAAAKVSWTACGTATVALATH